MLTPFAERLRCFFQRDNRTDCFFDGETPFLNHADHPAKIFGQSIARSQDVEFFLYEGLVLLTYRFFGVADVNPAAGEGDFFDGHPKCFRLTDGLDDDVGAGTAGEFAQGFANVLLRRVNQVRGSSLAGNLELGVVNVDADGARAGVVRSCDCTQADAAAAENGDSIFFRDPSPRHRVEADRQRFDDAKFLQAELRGVESFRGHGDEFGHRAVALHPERLIELAGIGTIAAARRALATTGVRRHGDVYAGGEARVG